MSRRRNLFLMCLPVLFMSVSTLAQVTVRFQPVIAGKELLPDSCYYLGESNDTVCISVFKFYVSSVVLRDTQGRDYKEKNSYHLLQAGGATGLSFTLPLQEDFIPASLVFLLGIDSATNSAGVRGGDLDPVMGMYWTWMSGYIHLKLEGHFLAGGEESAAFEYHLGGYRAPYSTVQKIEISVTPSRQMVIPVDVGTFFEQSANRFPGRIMSPGSNAAKLSAITATMFPSFIK